MQGRGSRQLAPLPHRFRPPLPVALMLAGWTVCSGSARPTRGIPPRLSEDRKLKPSTSTRTTSSRPSRICAAIHYRLVVAATIAPALTFAKRLNFGIYRAAPCSSFGTGAAGIDIQDLRSTLSLRPTANGLVTRAMHSSASSNSKLARRPNRRRLSRPQWAVTSRSAKSKWWGYPRSGSGLTVVVDSRQATTSRRQGQRTSRRPARSDALGPLH